MIIMKISYNLYYFTDNLCAGMIYNSPWRMNLCEVDTMPLQADQI